LYILASAVRVAKESIDVLMDRRLPAEVDEQVASIIARFHNEGVYGFHDIRTRRSGSYKFIDLHVEVDNTQSLMQSHGVTVRVIKAIEAEIPRSKVHAHTDPVARKD
jgi:ferrous-iron efflux pump FieF